MSSHLFTSLKHEKHNDLIANICKYLHRDNAFMMRSSFMDNDLRRIGRETCISFKFSLSSTLCLYRLLWIGLPTDGGSGRLNVFARHSNDVSISGMGLNISGVVVVSCVRPRFTFPSVILRHRRNTGVRLIVSWLLDWVFIVYELLWSFSSI